MLPLLSPLATTVHILDMITIISTSVGFRQIYHSLRVLGNGTTVIVSIPAL